jgi:hypothetical protein
MLLPYGKQLVKARQMHQSYLGRQKCADYQPMQVEEARTLVLNLLSSEADQYETFISRRVSISSVHCHNPCNVACFEMQLTPCADSQRESSHRLSRGTGSNPPTTCTSAFPGWLWNRWPARDRRRAARPSISSRFVCRDNYFSKPRWPNRRLSPSQCATSRTGSPGRITLPSPQSGGPPFASCTSSRSGLLACRR